MWRTASRVFNIQPVEDRSTVNPNRQLDRFHAIAALPYCDLFVTSDRELVKKTQAVRSDLKFKIAEVVSGEEVYSQAGEGLNCEGGVDLCRHRPIDCFHL